ncbi:hypothetical protein M378DRAFT_950205 [Amanita muscaria Koide BX008]|uniref:Uncharacterized protein n=1 Tax=Amanita muscaria (strain Koide BX008) TaxID=946122 RepID=A0A0C2T1F7_AMAMK|nr:hypothetical protein M378DRAFT_950205 [Amanita muscaria Koide BX008]
MPCSADMNYGTLSVLCFILSQESGAVCLSAGILYYIKLCHDPPSFLLPLPKHRESRAVQILCRRAAARIPGSDVRCFCHTDVCRIVAVKEPLHRRAPWGKKGIF